MTVITSRLDQKEINIMLELMKLEYFDFENQDLEKMADQISLEFKVDCYVEDLEEFYSDNEDSFNEFELRPIELSENYYNNLLNYEDRDRYKEVSKV